MRTILVATDFSVPASNAVNYAANLAKQTEAELILFSVYKVSIHASNSLTSTASIDKVAKRSEDKLEALAQRISLDQNIKVSWVLRKDDTIESLKEYTSTHYVDLVVMGIESNLTEYKLFGNTTTAAIQLMMFPLLVVPNDIDFDGIDKVMYACEPSYLKDGCELGFLKRFVNENNADLEVFHVITENNGSTKDEEMEKIMNHVLSDIKHTYRYVQNSRVGEGISEGLEASDPDLLVMIPHKLGFFESLVKRSNTNHMTVKTRVPLLVIPNEKAC